MAAQPPLEKSLNVVTTPPGNTDVDIPPAAPDNAVMSDTREAIFRTNALGVSYGENRAFADVSMEINRNLITAIIGPSGCGKSSLIRCFNRMNDLIPSAKVQGQVLYHEQDLYSPQVDPVEVRRRIGMVFQKPNPFPKSISDNISFGLQVNGMKDQIRDRVEDALKKAALWDEVKRDLKASALSLSGGQQQRLCIARALAVEPEVILMDEPASALDPIATARIEDLMQHLKEEYTIIIVTHNMQQAARVSDMTAFLSVDVDEDQGTRTGRLVEFAPTSELFTRPKDSRTEGYITGRFG